MAKYGIISDTHITSNDNPEKIENLLNEIEKAFNDVDEIIHAGDVCEKFFLEELNRIAPTRVVKGNFDQIKELEEFIIFSDRNYNIGVIHQQPDNLQDFFEKNNLHILIYGHTHQPLIKGTPYNTLIINPGSPTRPKAPIQKKGFKEPIARPSVITLKIDKDNILTTFIINLSFKF